MSKISRLVLVALLVVGGLALVAPQEVSAGCTKLCQRVSHPTNPFCRQCVETGVFQGAHCEQVSACFCLYEDTCAQFASTTPSPLDGVLTEEPNATPADAATPAEALAEVVEEPAQATE